MKENGGGLTWWIVIVSVIFAASMAVVFVCGYLSDDGENGFGSFYSGPESETKLPAAAAGLVVVAAAARRGRVDESRAVLSSDFSSKFKPTASRRASNKVEQGLARARYAIRKAAAASIGNKSVIIGKN